MDDSELEAIRARRLQELQSKYGKPENSEPANNMSMQEQQKAAQEKEERIEDMRNTILTQVLTQEARARLSNIASAKPDKARMIEDTLILNARRGSFRGKLSEEQLIDFLKQFNEHAPKKKTKVTYDRKKTALDDDDDDDDLDLDS